MWRREATKRGGEKKESSGRGKGWSGRAAANFLTFSDPEIEWV